MRLLGNELDSLREQLSKLSESLLLIDSKMALISSLISDNVDKDVIGQIGGRLKTNETMKFAMISDELIKQTALVQVLIEMKFREYSHFFCELEKHKGA